MEFASEMVIKAALSRLRIDEVPATLSPDLRDRPPHLRPWRDGWRHLRYLLMLSPTWLFGVPALAAMLLACVIFAMAGLHQTGLLSGPQHIGTGWTILAGFLLTSGHFFAPSWRWRRTSTACAKGTGRCVRALPAGRM
ncbi:hypothetical protein ACFSTD_03985 [Novosphingobium colocasiae]